MDRMHGQLERLQAGARRTEHLPHVNYDVSNHNAVEYVPHSRNRRGDGQAQGYHAPIRPNDGIGEQPMMLGLPYDQLAGWAGTNNGQDPIPSARARVPLQFDQTWPESEGYAVVTDRGADTSQRRSHLQYAGPRAPYEYASGQTIPLSLRIGSTDPFDSSPYLNPCSSPAFMASQRRPGIVQHSSDDRQRQLSVRHHEQEHGAQPFLVEDNEAEYVNTQAQQGTLSERTRVGYVPVRGLANANFLRAAPPVVQGINLVPTRDLPDRFRSIFPYPLFNAVQSKCFETLYKTENNLVLSSPTGSGKTAALELAICRLLNGHANGSFKIVYQAPTKSLCSERQRDWQAKFAAFDLQCAELTGDTENAHLRNVQHASIIITTPEKWDSMTRKWKDHQRLMQMVKLFLIDEVHILKEDRGATLEAVVSRMKSIGSNVRFIALSATVPNSDDIATWLGRNHTMPQLPATREVFGEEFRPVRLQKFVQGYVASANDFAFDKALNSKLTDVISKYSKRKPIMVFCFTRNACVETAKLLSLWWDSQEPRERYWTQPRTRVNVIDKDLQETVSSGVAFHHAGLSVQDRTAIESSYTAGDTNVICCTSTLAVGVNLPCHMVIIKNTVSYSPTAAGGCREYSDLEIVQMLGRAGRPQFDDSAVAVIMTRKQREKRYEKMVKGQEILESCLHRNLIEHLNAEICLGTITNLSSARKWLSGTFLSVRLKENPEHYKIEGDAPERSFEERLDCICSRAISALREHDLALKMPQPLQCTEYGDAMARYYLQFNTMKRFLALPPKAKLSEILSAVSQANEFSDIRFRQGEKPMYKELNKNGSIKFPIPVNLDIPAHKVSLIIQAVLGAIDLPTEDYKSRLEFANAKAGIFHHANRLVRCIVDCTLHLEDAVAARNALMLARSLGAQVWDDSPLHMKQLEGIGLVYVRKLAVAGIRSIEDIELAEPRRIESAIGRHPPFGSQMQEKAKIFPKLKLSLKLVGDPTVKKGEAVTVRVQADIGFLNLKVPESFQSKPVYICLLVEVSDGRLVNFTRLSAKALKTSEHVTIGVDLATADQSIRAYVMCDGIAGTLRYATLKPDISLTSFQNLQIPSGTTGAPATKPSNIFKRRADAVDAVDAVEVEDNRDNYDDAEIDDAALAEAETGSFVDIDELEDAVANKPKTVAKKQKADNGAARPSEPQQLGSGRWACNHQCKDKTSCGHLCCRNGLDRKPKLRKSKAIKPSDKSTSNSKQKQLDMSVLNRAAGPTRTVSPVAKAAIGKLQSSTNGAGLQIPTAYFLYRQEHEKDSDASPTSRGTYLPSCLSAAQEPFSGTDSTEHCNNLFEPDSLPTEGAPTKVQRAPDTSPPPSLAASQSYPGDIPVSSKQDTEDRRGQELLNQRGDEEFELSSSLENYENDDVQPLLLARTMRQDQDSSVLNSGRGAVEQIERDEDPLFVSEMTPEYSASPGDAHEAHGGANERGNESHRGPIPLQAYQSPKEITEHVESHTGQALSENENMAAWFAEHFGTEYFNYVG